MIASARALGDRAVIVIQPDLDAAAHRRAINGGQCRDLEIHDSFERTMSHLTDFEKILFCCSRIHTHNVGADIEDERLASQDPAFNILVFFNGINNFV